MFFYKNDTQETDIEYLTDPSSQSNKGPDMPIPIWYTNQAVNPGNGKQTSQNGPAPTNCCEKSHEYRLDWTQDSTTFYINGRQQRKFTTNVPSVPGPFVWNNWANGDPGKLPNLNSVLPVSWLIDDDHRLVSRAAWTGQRLSDQENRHVL